MAGNHSETSNSNIEVLVNELGLRQYKNMPTNVKKRVEENGKIISGQVKWQV